ncbi:hypothetical protein [Frankia sp. R82]|uniref:hypothetical protein n=1 Tax=Frankia sp. R82 TaxID=2950553 RepID=UPI002042C173|nr:hypothetical protein [Frankia sp. R82]MCM3883391.1 hypothetical protein [Frankia sp. R82]
MPQAASRGAILAMVTPLIFAAIAAPGVISALTRGRTRTMSLLVCVGVELVIMVCIGLYIRLRQRA